MGIRGSLGRKCLNRPKNYCCPALGIDLRGSIVLDQGGYRIWFATSHQEVETKISFPLFRLFRGNGSWCRISRVQSPSHHIISELKNSPPQAILRNIFCL